MRLPAEVWIVTIAVLIAAGLVMAGRSLVPSPPRRMALPTASELVALEPYLNPGSVGGDIRVGVPPEVAIEGDPFGTPLPERTPTAAQQTQAAPRWKVTAIMIAGERRMAIVNDKLVRPGDRMEDGARIEAVEQDHVVLITPSGERRRLDLER